MSRMYAPMWVLNSKFHTIIWQFYRNNKSKALLIYWPTLFNIKPLIFDVTK